MGQEIYLINISSRQDNLMEFGAQTEILYSSLKPVDQILFHLIFLKNGLKISVNSL